ncbi:protein phosphatase 2A regulatory subunit [Cryptosporidium canis]|uniref:Protein phosphatase 2A regulatory subunit n=1 Tax=Cryptosporidium canis TaxID=195482 RepID=A0A9D5DJQ9_9CRYT|nr:protein phosphatase 2A regulatory subunit [Cryptosporidium canis]
MLLEKDIQCLFFEFVSSQAGIDQNDENVGSGNCGAELARVGMSVPVKQLAQDDTVSHLREAFRRGEDDLMSCEDWEVRVVEGVLGMNRLCSGTLYGMMFGECGSGCRAPRDYLSARASIQIEYSRVEELVCRKLDLRQGQGEQNYFKLLSRLSGSRDCILPGGFRPVLSEIVQRHRALQFLASDNVFRELYIETVISRIFYELDVLELRRLRLKDFRGTSLVGILLSMRGDESFDDLTDYFDYQHFYVLYSRFVELDVDGDQSLALDEFKRHDFGAITESALARIWDCNIRGKRGLFRDEVDPARKMSYHDFIYFYISDEDKTTERSIRYWFEIIDFDCDGWIGLQEIDHFYREQKARCRDLSYAVPELDNISCMVNDLLMPGIQCRYRLDDFLRNKLVAGHFFNILVNTKKCLSSMFMDGELNSLQTVILQRSGFKAPSPWDLHCQYQYQIIQDSRQDEASIQK